MTEPNPEACGAILDVTLSTSRRTTNSLRCIRPPHSPATEHVSPQGSTWRSSEGRKAIQTLPLPERENEQDVHS